MRGVFVKDSPWKPVDWSRWETPSVLSSEFWEKKEDEFDSLGLRWSHCIYLRYEQQFQTEDTVDGVDCNMEGKSSWVEDQEKNNISVFRFLANLLVL